MAKAKTQQTDTSTPPTTVPSSSGDLGTTTDPQTGPSTALEKADASSSHNISISSINQDDQDEDGGNDSSVFESSDSECDDEHIKKAIERIPQTLQPGGGQLVQNGTALLVSGEGSPSGQTSSSGPNIGSIAVQNSSDITFGNKTYIKGQVVIKNIYHDRQNGGVDNKGYNETDGEMGMPNGKKDSTTQPPQPLSWRSSLKAIIRDKPLLSVIILVALIVIMTTIIVVVVLTTSADEDFLDGPRPLRIVTRNEWLAQPPRDNLTLLKLPVHRVIIAHTATEECKTQDQCIYRVRFMQEHHIGVLGMGDIAYNFMVGGDGSAYEGRGWLKQGAFLKGQNSVSEGIAFIGDYRRLAPTREQMALLDDLLSEGVRAGHIAPDYKLFGALQLQATESPGRLLYEELKKHPHWSDYPLSAS